MEKVHKPSDSDCIYYVSSLALYNDSDNSMVRYCSEETYTMKLKNALL
jgi:hypothetical protein